MPRAFTPLKDRLMSKVKYATNGCWEFSGFQIPKGYCYIGLRGRGRKIPAHRASWIVFRGKIPDGMCVLHKCDNPPCINPEHLFIGTKADNNKDMRQKKRDCRGENSPMARLRQEDVDNIKSLHGIGISQVSISNQFGISRAEVCRIVNNVRWKT